MLGNYIEIAKSAMLKAGLFNMQIAEEDASGDQK
jgi:hypothetical protein